MPTKAASAAQYYCRCAEELSRFVPRCPELEAEMTDAMFALLEKATAATTQLPEARSPAPVRLIPATSPGRTR